MALHFSPDEIVKGSNGVLAVSFSATARAPARVAMRAERGEPGSVREPARRRKSITGELMIDVLRFQPLSVHAAMGRDM
jgi:hypothetical protein